MKGYWEKPEETASTLRDGWLYTGDICTMDFDGYFYVVDRKKDMIIAGGFNIYPHEIDEVLFEHPPGAGGRPWAFPTSSAARPSRPTWS
ncbi:MAG: AMP-binding protein [Actinomycetota bacterium]|nr:AMP-binding protein [Actinomycetota bacterium]